jgi:hypothetical protein
MCFNLLNAGLNPICHPLALLGAHHILHVSRIRVNVEEVNARIRLQHQEKMKGFTWLAAIFRNHCKGKGHPVKCYEGPEGE